MTTPYQQRQRAIRVQRSGGEDAYRANLRKERRFYTVLAIVILVICAGLYLQHHSVVLPGPTINTPCRDGWVSHSTGSGTCSYHGGEAN
jgi:hypothetical protein